MSLQLGSEAELAAITSRVCRVANRTTTAADPIIGLRRRIRSSDDNDDDDDKDIDTTSHLAMRRVHTGDAIPSSFSDDSTSSSPTAREQHYSNHSSSSWLKANRNQLRSRTSSSSYSPSRPSYSPSHPSSSPAMEQHPTCGPEVILDPRSTLLPLFSPHSQQLQTTPLLSRPQQIYLLKLFAASRYRMQQELLSSSSSVSASFIASTNSHSSTAVEPPISLQPTQSFVDYRMSSDGLTVGPLAFFGAFSHSLLMTRSIGDRLGPRGCIALPDITVHTIPSHKHARYSSCCCILYTIYYV